MTAEERWRLAEAHLDRARAALAQGDRSAAVLWTSVAAEVAIDLIAEREQMVTRQDHRRRATIARRLFEAGALPEDLSDLAVRLNDERKHAVYHGRTPNLRGRDWDTVIDQVGALVAAARPMGS